MNLISLFFNPNLCKKGGLNLDVRTDLNQDKTCYFGESKKKVERKRKKNFAFTVV